MDDAVDDAAHSQHTRERESGPLQPEAPYPWPTLSRGLMAGLSPTMLLMAVLAVGLLATGNAAIDSLCGHTLSDSMPAWARRGFAAGLGDAFYLPSVLFQAIAGWLVLEGDWQSRVWSVARVAWLSVVFGLCGGCLFRHAATAICDRHRGLPATVRFLRRHGVALVLVPGGMVWVAASLLVLGDVAHLAANIPLLGTALSILLWLPQALLRVFAGLSLAMTFVAWPLMCAAVATEGGDCFDATSRGLNFLLSRPLAALAWLLTGNLLCVAVAAVGIATVQAVGGSSPGWPMLLAHAAGLAVWCSWSVLAFVRLRYQIDAIETDEIVSADPPQHPADIPLVGRAAYVSEDAA